MVRAVFVNPQDTPAHPPGQPSSSRPGGPEEATVGDLVSVPFPGSEGTAVADEGDFPNDSGLSWDPQLPGSGVDGASAGPDSWFLSPFDQTTLAGLLLLAAVAMIGWSAWQAATIRTRLIDIDRARRTELRFEVDLNTAPAAELACLPGVGPKLAAAIVSYREEQGEFSSPDQLLNVSGIGTAKLQGLLPFLRPLERVESEPAPR